MSWKRMIPGLSDTILLFIMGATVLQVASIVLISSLAINISFGSIIVMTILHNKENIYDNRFKFYLFKISFSFALIYIFLSVVSLYYLPPEIKNQSFLFLIISALRPIISASNIYYREILIINKKDKYVHSSLNISNLVYITSSWIIITILINLNINLSILWFLVPIYLSIFFNNLYYKKNINNLKFFKFNINKIKILNIRSSLYSGFLNIYEVGFIALLSWVINIKFPNFSTYIFPLFNLFEIASALAIGINRNLTNYIIENKNTVKLIYLISIYTAYSLTFSCVYFYLFHLFKKFNNLFILIIFGFLYVLLDGIQLILRSYTQASNDDSKIIYLSTITYTLSIIILSLAYFNVSEKILIISIFLPLVILSFFIIGFGYVRNTKTLQN